MTFDNRLLTTMGAALVGLGVALPYASEEAFTPSKPSEILTVRHNGNSCTAIPSGAKIDSLVDPADGSVSPFVVPNGQVFVITDALFSFNGSPGDYTVSINALTPTAPFAFVPIAEAPFTIAPANGGGTVHVGHAVVKPGLELCFSTSGGPTVGATLTNAVRGFLMDDK